ncbi:hypothetical protein [Streptomyces sp. MAI_2237]
MGSEVVGERGEFGGVADQGFISAETERENIREAALEGLDTAARKGKHGGRPPVITDDMLHTVLRHRAGGGSVEQVQPDLIHPIGKRKGHNPRWRASTGRWPNTPSARRIPRPSSRPTPTSLRSTAQTSLAPTGRCGAQLVTMMFSPGFSVPQLLTPGGPVGSGQPESVQRELAGRCMCVSLTNPRVRREPWGGLRGGGLRP